MLYKTETVNGKRRIVITREASGEDKVKEAMSVVMGQGWILEDETKDNCFNVGKLNCTSYKEMQKASV